MEESGVCIVIESKTSTVRLMAVPLANSECFELRLFQRRIVKGRQGEIRQKIMACRFLQILIFIIPYYPDWYLTVNQLSNKLFAVNLGLRALI